MALPGNVTYATIQGRFVKAVADTTDDPDTEPDATPAQGQVHFIPNVVSLLNMTSTPPTVIVPQRVTIDLDTDGYLELNGSHDIKLLACDNPDLNPMNWTYTVRYALVDAEIPEISVRLLGDTTVDVTQLVPVGVSAGAATLMGPPGPAGSGTGDVQSVNGVSPSSGNITLTADDIDAAEATHTHDATDITSGALAEARIPTLPQSKITNLTTDLGNKADSVHAHSGGEITTGTVGIARLPVAASGVSSSTQLVRADDSRLGAGGGGTGTVTSVNGDAGPAVTLDAADVGAAATSHSHAAGDVSSGTFADARIPSLNASKITAGTLDVARMPLYVESVNGDSGEVDVTVEGIEGVRNLTPTLLTGIGVGTSLPTAGSGHRLFILIPE